MVNEELRFSEAGEKLVGKRWKVLDKGFVGLVSYHGTDALIEAAARCSYQKGTRTTNDRRGLIRYLIRNHHSSPVEQGNITFELKMPLFCIQQLLRHRTARLNQESFRYSEVKDEVCQTGEHEWRLQSGTNKQGSSGLLEAWPENEEIKAEYQQKCFEQFDSPTYESGPVNYLNYMESNVQKYIREVYEERMKLGVAKEQARKDISVSTYSTLYWQMDIRNLLHFMSLRCDSHAQLEIRFYANIIAGIVKELFPITFEAWYDYHFAGTSLSRMEIQLLNYEMGLQNPENVVESDVDPLLAYATTLGLSKREFDEYVEKTKVKPIQDFSLDKYEIYEPKSLDIKG